MLDRVGGLQRVLPILDILPCFLLTSAAILCRDTPVLPSRHPARTSGENAKLENNILIENEMRVLAAAAAFLPEARRKVEKFL